MTTAQRVHAEVPFTSARPQPGTSTGEGAATGAGSAATASCGPEMSDTHLARVDSTPSVWLFG